MVAVGIASPYSPLAPLLGFQALPIGFFAALTGMVVAYLALIEFAKSTARASSPTLTNADEGRLKLSPQSPVAHICGR